MLLSQVSHLCYKKPQLARLIPHSPSPSTPTIPLIPHHLPSLRHPFPRQARERHPRMSWSSMLHPRRCWAPRCCPASWRTVTRVRSGGQQCDHSPLWVPSYEPVPAIVRIQVHAIVALSSRSPWVGYWSLRLLHVAWLHKLTVGSGACLQEARGG
jgi:hypothetical protein